MPDYRITIKCRDKHTTMEQDRKDMQEAFTALIDAFDIEKVESWNGKKWIELQ